ncbi:hypothetical protein [Thermofilum sp.]|uniref:hypothetical protein n=1 Tax=Thermofilum sp. TaxID=1961369 RepID=UPI0031647B4A
MESVKRHVNAYLIFSIITSLIGTALGVLLVNINPYTAFPWLLTTLLAFLTSLVGVIRLRGISEPYKYGVVSIQHMWWVASTGLAGVTFYPADYFIRVGGVKSVIMFVISAIWLIWGLYLIYVVHKETKAPVAP